GGESTHNEKGGKGESPERGGRTSPAVAGEAPATAAAAMQPEEADDLRGHRLPARAGGADRRVLRPRAGRAPLRAHHHLAAGTGGSPVLGCLLAGGDRRP